MQHGEVVEERKPVLPHATLDQVSSSAAEAVQHTQWKGLWAHGRSGVRDEMMCVMGVMLGVKLVR